MILLTFLGSLIIVLLNMVTILMMSPKMATIGLFKIKVLKNKVYDVISSVQDVTSSSMGKVIITSIL